MADVTIAANETLTERLDLEGADVLRVFGTLTVADEDESVRVTGPADGLRILNSGVIDNTVAEDGRAIRFEEEIGTTIEARIANTGLIRSDDDAIQINNENLSSGVIRVDNKASGEIRANGGQAIDFADATGDFTGEINNRGLIASDANDGVKLGGVGNVLNAGVIAGGAAEGYSGSSDGVSYEDDATGTIDNSGSITGDRHGVDAGEGTVITVINREGGELIGHNGSGVGSDGSATVINHGTIIGQFADADGSDVNGATPGEEDGGGPDGVNDGDGDGVDIDFEAHIENFGTIRGAGAGGNGSDGFPNTSEGIAAGGGEIVNHEGARISGKGLGILIDDSSQGNAGILTEIQNHGVIKGGSGHAIRIVSDLDDVVSNDGLIRGGDGVALEFGSGDNTLEIGTGSQMIGLSIGGDGVDTLDYRGFEGAVAVDLRAGAATGTDGIESFETVRGATSADRLFGTTGDERLNGSKGDDLLIGRGGDDTLIGGKGDDVFRFTTAPDDGVATITDFAIGQDELQLRADVFGLTKGDLDASAFETGPAATAAASHVLYDAGTGALLFDADGRGGAAAIQFAQLTAGLDLSADDFRIV